LSVEFVSYFDYVQYPPVLPELEHGLDINQHPVCIVGGGPIGFALALGLARYGIKSVILEADSSVCVGSRAGCVTSRTLEIFEQLSVAAPVMRQGLPWSEGWSYFRDAQILKLEIPQDPLAAYPRLVNIQQCYVEQYLLDAISKYPNLIEVRWQSSVVGMKSTEDMVELDVQTPVGSYQVRSDWVVAADGAHSIVRKSIGARFFGTRYDGSYVIVDIKMASRLKEGRRAWFDPPSNPGATLLMHKHRDDLWRFDYQLREDEDPEEAVRPDNVLARVRGHLEFIGETADWKPVWISMYKASCLTLEQYRHGRVLLAGDAAHLVPIFGVRGMNSGIDDTHNLAWKLAFVIKGLARPKLLDSYSDERVFATRENMRHASKSAEFMAPPTKAFALMRQAALGLAVKHSWVSSLVDPRQSTAVGFPHSPLNVYSQESEFARGPAPGENLPDLVLPGNRHLSSALGPHFTAIVFDDPSAMTHALPSVDAPTRLLSIANSDQTSHRFDAKPGTTYLVRPDGHLLARWRRYKPSDIATAINTCCNGGLA